MLSFMPYIQNYNRLKALFNQRLLRQQLCFLLLNIINGSLLFKKPVIYAIPLIFNLAVNAQVYDFKPVYTESNISVNRILPKNILAANEIISVHFSKEPTDEEIFKVHFFEEPLIPSVNNALPEENAALIYALASYSQRNNPDDFKSVNQFLQKYPVSRWNGALLANLGIVYRRTGYYSEAMNAWQKAWNILKNQKDSRIKVLADKVISELLLINAWVGRKEKIESLLNEIKDRVIEGPAVERISSIRKALWTMENKPGISFKCGPYALNKIFLVTDTAKAFNEKLMEVQSTARGFSLYELEKMSHEVKLNYQMAYRNPGAKVILNSVVHWKLDHYSALLKEESGHYKCEDATMGTVYGQQFWLTPSALDSSASGYFLVPEGLLPGGWRKVDPQEGSKVFGKGHEPPDDGKHITPEDIQCPSCNARKPMAQSNVHAAAVSLHIFDRPVYYTPPKGPAVTWDVDYHQRDSYQPANFSYSNMGPKWTFNWLSYIQDNPYNVFGNADLYVMGGGVRTFTSYDTSTKSYSPELQTKDLLVRVCPTCYEIRHPDGSKEVYARPDGSTAIGRKIFLTEQVDVAGNKLTVSYDTLLRIVALKDALGQVSTLKYENNSDSYKITKVTDPFGRSASFKYDSSGRLSQITDMIGIVSSFNYEGSDFINQMSTPYGLTKFVKTEGLGSTRSLETHYPLGEKERVEFTDNAPGIAFTEAIYPEKLNLFNQWMTYRNTFYWDKKAMKEAPEDYTKARIFHWLHGSGGTGESGFAAPLLESIKEPLENRVWFNYQAQTWAAGANQGMSSKPSLIARVLDDSTTQISQFEYNSLGMDTVSIDPSGRKLTYKYAQNNIDLLEVRQTTNGINELLATFTYNSKHLPLTAKDASGLITRYTYNASGQLNLITNPKKEKTALFYNTNGYLDSITGPVKGSRSKFTYDGFGRVRSVTDPEGYTITTDYDVLDRPTLITYPDSTNEQIVYNRLDAAHTKDRLGRWSHTIYDSLQRSSVLQDALGRITQLIWCSCGSLAEIVDPLKHITTFSRDVQGRVIRKTFHDGKSINYKYENTTSRLKEVTDAKGQKTQLSYYIDDNLKEINYTNASIPTPSVFYTYDSVYNRIAAMKDGTGTTTYAYNPLKAMLGAGRLAAIDGPLANDVMQYTYDSLSREGSRSVNGVTSSVLYDALGRITAAKNALGSFGYKYVNQTEQLSSVAMPNGQSTVFSYFNNMGNQRLSEIWNKASNGTTLSKFNYIYDKEGQIKKWTQQADTATPAYYELDYDLADQLTYAALMNGSNSATLKRYTYQYDKAGNRTSEQIDNSVTSSVYNKVNQLTKRSDGGPMLFWGSVSKFSAIQIKNQTASDSAMAAHDSTNTHYGAWVKVVPGSNNVSITATDYSGNNNKATNNYNINVTNGVNDTLAYDNNGNTLSATASGAAYGWDAADRLVKITQGTDVTEFVYDGLSRRVAEKLNGTVIQRWLWCGTELCEKRDSGGGTVTRRFFPQGEQIRGVNYYYTKDHLGSVREMIAADGLTIKARYNYDPYGRRTLTAGTDLSNLGFTGHYFHKRSSLYLTLYRAYDANTARWLSRDPIEEQGGLNQYAYVDNNPTNFADPSGLVRAEIHWRRVGLWEGQRSYGSHSYILVWDTDSKGRNIGRPYIFAGYNHDMANINDYLLHKYYSWFDKRCDDYQYGGKGGKYNTSNWYHGVGDVIYDPTKSAADFIRRFRTVANAIERKRIFYFPFWKNSNSFVTTLFKEGLGISPISPGLYAPGWHLNLISGKWITPR